ncbi:MAG: hypothetical protein ACHQ51_15810 [Elusimicrobiota bacterium]
MSPRARPLHREPLVVALVLTNIGLGAALLYKKSSPARGGLPPGHPDVTVPEAAPISAPSGPMGRDAEMAPEFAEVAAAARGQAPSAEFSITGTVKLSGKLKEPWPAGAPVFVIARAEQGGPPFAVRRYDGVKAPFRYSLGADNVMMAGTAAPKRLTVSVRVDQDGDAMTRQMGDLEGGPSAPIGTNGTADVTVDRPATLAP